MKFAAAAAVLGVSAAAIAAGVAVARPFQDGGAAGPPAAGEGGRVAADRDSFADRVEELASPDLGVREKAYTALRDAGKAAKAALARGSKSKDPQVRWASQRLLRLLREGDGDAPGVFRLRFDEDEAGTEDAGGVVEAPRDRALPFGFPRADLEARLEELRRGAEELQERVRRELGALRFGAVPGAPGSPFVAPGGSVRIHSDDGSLRREISMEDGKVRVTLTAKGEDGEEATESVEASSVDELREAHPQVWAKVKDLLSGGPGGGMRLHWGIAPVPPQAPRLRLFDTAPDRGVEARVVLGVTVSAVPEVLRSQLAIPAGEGAVIEGVQADSLAERLGLQRHDVLLAVNGLPVSEADDVRGAVGAVAKGGEIRMRILRGGKERELAGHR